MVELISIHIAKTGGQSFYEILKNEYGNKLDVRSKRRDYFPDRNYNNSLISRIPDHVSVIHGHLHYKHIAEIHKKHHSKIIAWFRDPVDRVISNYYYMIGRVNEIGKEHPQYAKRDHNLIEYAYDSVPNKMTKCLKGIDLEELFFFGFQESFDEDVKVLGKLLKWEKSIPNVHINTASSMNSWEKAPTPRSRITKEIKEEIARINEVDIQLYERAKSLKSTT